MVKKYKKNDYDCILSAMEICDEDLDIVERVLQVYGQFAELRLSKNEVAIVKLINFLNHGKIKSYLFGFL
jgi:hypothetical protein